MRSAISHQQKWITHPRKHVPEGTESCAPTTQQAERNVSRAPARQWISLRACASVCGRPTGTLIPTTEPFSFLSHTHTNHTRGWNVTHTPEGPESVRKEGHGAVQVTQLPALLPGGGRAMGKERRGASTTAHAHAHCTNDAIFQARRRTAAWGGGCYHRAPTGHGGSWLHRTTAHGGSCCHRAPGTYSTQEGAAAIGRQRKDGAGARRAWARHCPH